MRRRKQKQTRKAIRFYRINHGFRMPFKVLVDGNFIHQLLQLKMKGAEEVIPKLLGGTCRLFTTTCIQHELKKLGTDFKDTWRASRKLLMHKCGHDASPRSASDCIKSLIGTDNHDHFFVASQDKTLWTALLKIPAGAVIQTGANGVHLLSPSDKQEKVVQQLHTSASALPRAEQVALKPLLGKRTRGDGQLQYNDSKFVCRKRAKAPNPLSCKAKQLKERVVRPRAKDARTNGQTDTDVGHGDEVVDKVTTHNNYHASRAMHALSAGNAGQQTQHHSGEVQPQAGHRKRARARQRAGVTGAV